MQVPDQYVAGVYGKDHALIREMGAKTSCVMTFLDENVPGKMQYVFSLTKLDISIHFVQNKLIMIIKCNVESHDLEICLFFTFVTALAPLTNQHPQNVWKAQRWDWAGLAPSWACREYVFLSY